MLEWKSQYYYKGFLIVRRKLDHNQYLTRIAINFLNENNIRRTVSFDGVMNIDGNDVVIHCSNPTVSWWVTDDFYLKWSKDVMEGYSVDKTGRRGSARFSLVKGFVPPEQ
jgi:hypothetical protein